MTNNINRRKNHRKLSLLVTVTVAVGLAVCGTEAIATDLAISLEGSFYAQSQPSRLETADDYYNRGLERYRQGDIDGAIADFTRAIELDPELADSYKNRGFVRYDQGDLEGAIADFNRVIELNSEDAVVYYGRAVAYHDQGNLEEALADFNRAIELNPEDAIAFYNRGLAYQDLQRYLESLL